MMAQSQLMAHKGGFIKFLHAAATGSCLGGLVLDQQRYVQWQLEGMYNGNWGRMEWGEEGTKEFLSGVESKVGSRL